MANNSILNPWASQNDVTYNPSTIDQGTQGIINQDTGLASQDAGTIAGNLNQGVSQEGNKVLQGSQQGNQGATATGQNPAMLAAIRNQFNAQAQSGINQITQNNTTNAQLTKANYLQQAAQFAQAQQNVENNTFAELTGAYNDANAARAQAISSVLSLGGTAGGMAMANNKRSNAPRQQTQNIGSQQTEFTGPPGGGGGQYAMGGEY